MAGNGDSGLQLEQAVYRLPVFSPLPPSASSEIHQPAAAVTLPPPERHISEGSFFVDNDRIVYQSLGVQGVLPPMAATR